MLHIKQDTKLIDFIAQAEMNGYKEKEDGPLFIDKKNLPQEIIDLAEAMIRGDAGYKVVYNSDVESDKSDAL